MAQQVNVKNTGLRGVTVADSKISFIDGENGVLIYRGYRIEELAERSTFLETAFLLLNGALPSADQLKAFSGSIRRARRIPEYVTASMKRWPREARAMDVLQAVVPLLAMDETGLDDLSRPSLERQAANLIARIPVVVAAWHRTRNGLEALESDDDLGHAANFLYLLTGERPTEATARDLDVCLVLQADHTFNASTFACREVVSTRAHMYAGVTGGLGALSGSLHGGANMEVMKMLLSLEHETDVPGWVARRLEQGDRVMGLGHAIYKTFDPRARYLKVMAGRLGEETGLPWPRLSQEIEDAALAEFEKRGKANIKPNLDFYSAPVLYMMGIPADLMTPVFAMSRVAGWTAHILEEVLGEAQGKPTLYRPKAEYVGNYCGLMGCEYHGVDERKADDQSV